jgi:cytochrome c2
MNRLRPAVMTIVAGAFGALCAITASGGALARDTGPAWQVQGGDAARGRKLVSELGCAGCHTIPGVRGANGKVGPPLREVGDRQFIAGMLRNEPENLVRWLRNPQSVVPGNAMPDMGITEQQARDIAAFLYTLR